jgi:hypothetical protein
MTTMKRCASPPTLGGLGPLPCAAPSRFIAAHALARGLWAALLLPLAALAQDPLPRHFSATTLRGELTVTSPPEVLLNGRASRLAPGVRIRGTNNLLLLSGALVGQRLTVHYTQDSLGQMLDVWLITATEAARRPWPTSAQEAQRWVFNADAQTWSKP